MEKPEIDDILPVEVINFPESEKVSGLLEDLIKKIEALDLVVNVKEQKIDIQEIVKSIKEIPQGKDYTQILEGISEKLNEEPEEEKEDPEKKEKLKVLKDIHKAIKEVNTTQDFTPILELLQLIALKEDPEPPFSFDNGRLLVTVDRVSSGGGGLKQSESEALISIPEKPRSDVYVLIKKSNLEPSLDDEGNEIKDENGEVVMVEKNEFADALDV